MALRQLLWLRHQATARRVPVEVPTVFGRSDSYYRYTSEDERPDRLRSDVVEGLSALNYVKLCSDDQASRTHGLLDPRIPAICDLNSTNGVFLNGHQVPTRPGDAGPLVSLSSRDVLTIGRQTFEVVLTEVSEHEIRAQVEAQRQGFVASGPEDRDAARGLSEFLAQQRGFTMQEVVGWSAALAGCYRLQAAAHAEGISVVGLWCERRGRDLVMGRDAMPLEKLLPLLTTIPGRKVVVLVGPGDAQELEGAFEQSAYEDMVLVTAPPPRGDASEFVVPTFQSRVVDRALAHETLAGAQEALERLVAASTNILDVSWVARHDGPVHLVFGRRERSDEFALSHSLRFGSSTFRF